MITSCASPWVFCIFSVSLNLNKYFRRRVSGSLPNENTGFALIRSKTEWIKILTQSLVQNLLLYWCKHGVLGPFLLRKFPSEFLWGHKITVKIYQPQPRTFMTWFIVMIPKGKHIFSRSSFGCKCVSNVRFVCTILFQIIVFYSYTRFQDNSIIFQIDSNMYKHNLLVRSYNIYIGLLTKCSLTVIDVSICL